MNFHFKDLAYLKFFFSSLFIPAFAIFELPEAKLSGFSLICLFAITPKIIATILTAQINLGFV